MAEYSPPSGDAAALPLAGDYDAPAGNSVALAIPEPPACYSPPLGSAVGLPLAGGYVPPPGDAIDLAIECDVPLPPPLPEFPINLDNPPALMSMVGIAYRSERPQNAVQGMAWGSAQQHDSVPRITWADAQHHDRAVHLDWADALRLDTSTRIVWRTAERHDNALALHWRGAQRHDRSNGIAWDQALRVDTLCALWWGQGQSVDAIVRLRFNQAEQWADTNRLAWGPGAPHNLVDRIPWDGATQLELYDENRQEPVPPVETPDYCYTPPPGDMVPLAFESAQIHYTPPSGDAVELPIRCTGRELYFRRVRVIQHNVTVCRLPGREPLAVASIRIDNDWDSIARSFTLTLNTLASYLLVQPGPSGYHTIEIAIDGDIWEALVLGGVENRQSESAPSWTINCVGRSKLLDHPFVTRRSYSNPSALTAEALIANELSGTGWALDYTGPVWTVPAGVFTYANLSPIQAIQQIATACGCFVTHARDADTLIVRPRYGAWPWDWGTTPPDVTLANDALHGIGQEWQQGPGYLGVYVGGTTQGVLVQVRRNGSAGSPYADLVLDPLITDTPPAIQRGGTVIADAENQRPRPLLLPYLAGSPGEIFPGELVQVTDSVHGTFKSVAQASSITVQLRNDATVVEQSVRVAEHFPEVLP